MNKSFRSSTDKADVVIVGSGVAGGLLASQLANNGFQVIILEAGQRIDHVKAVERYRNSWRRDLQSPYQRKPHASFPDTNDDSDSYFSKKGKGDYWSYYLRLVGGSTWHWGGITPRLLPVDFRLKSTYGVGRDWPISYTDIESYYLKAEWELGVAGDSKDDHGSPRSGSYPMPATDFLYSDKVVDRYLKPHKLSVKVLPAARNSRNYRGRPACCGSNTCIPICPTGAKYSADVHINEAIKGGVQLIENAVANSININNAGYVESIGYKSPDGETHVISGRYYILACNAIETPKLLLMSRSIYAQNGIANKTGLVGKGIMDHPIIAKSYLMPEPLFNGRGPQFVSTITYNRDGMFRSNQSAAWFLLTYVPDIQSYVTKIIEEEKDWSNVDGRLEYYANHFIRISVLMEQLPDIENKIIPSDTEFDAIGIPKPEIYIKIDSYLQNAANHYSSFLTKLASYLNAKPLEDTESEIGKTWASHPMGTTIMGSNPDASVVDLNCRCHDHPNLFIAGSSVFPTGSCVPPTLTIAALSLRLADYLKSVISKENL